MRIVREIGEKGQVVIPKDLRDMLGIKTRENIVFEIQDSKVFLKKESNPEEFVRDFLNVPGKKKKGSAKKIKEDIYEQYEEKLH